MPTILVVEDDPVIALDVRTILEAAGFRTLGPAATVGDALAVVEADPIDAAVLDVRLRGASSEPVAAELRARGVPFVLLTALREIAPGLALHGAPLVQKPFRQGEPVAALRLVGIVAPRPGPGSSGGLAGLTIDAEGLPWQTWDDPGLAARSPLRWKLILSRGRTPTGAMTLGLAELPPGGVLPLHHHAPAELYHVLGGEGSAEVDGATHRLAPGTSLFIPPNARHRTTSTGPETLRFLFVFPTDSFEEIVYHHDE